METSHRLRLWPGVAAVVLQWLAVLGGGLAPGTPIQFFGMTGGPLIGVLLVIVWWLFASRAKWAERWLGLAILLGGLGLMFGLAHASMVLTIFVWGIPIACTTFVGAVVAFASAPPARRRLAVEVAVALAAAVMLLLRAEGVRGDMNADLAFRFAPTPEDRLLDSASRLPSGASGGTVDWTIAPWPEFRGSRRDGILHGVRIATDWEGSPPTEVWRRPVGPGWGSFSVAGGRLYTQEQRGEDEVVACYDAATGEPIWQHRDAARFWEALAGPGPRATPTLHDGRVYSFGGTGILNALDAGDGSVIWSRNAAEDTGAELPTWGFASSPLIVDDLVVVFTGAPDGKGLVAYDLESGEPRWHAGVPGRSYSSAQLAMLDGVRQIVLITGDGASGVAPDSGEVLWSHEWVAQGERIVQPAFTADGDLLIGTGPGMGVQRVSVARDGDEWSTTERWVSQGLKPYFNDLVVHDGHAYGFDGRIMSCIDLATGERRWKGGRYGHGQALLLADQGVILVLSESGDLALVEATPERFVELTRVPAIEGKTWNHPVLIDDMLYVRNGQEMAAFRLAG